MLATIAARSLPIHEYIAKDSEHYAGLTVARIFSSVERLIQFPHSGRIVPERDEPEIREIIVGRSRVVHRVREELLQVATVLGRQENFRKDSDHISMTESSSIANSKLRRSTGEFGDRRNVSYFSSPASNARFT